MEIKEKVQKFIDEKELNAYTTKEQWVLPYRNKNGDRFYLFIRLNNEDNIGIRMGFRAVIYQDTQEFIENLKTVLLDLNTKLKMGALALEKDSKIVEFSLDYSIEDKEAIDWEQYNRYVIFCMSVYLDLVNRKLVKESVIDE